MGNWIPGDPTLVGQILRICSAYAPAPPEGFVSPMLWGVEEQVIERFESAGIAKENISFIKETFTFNASYAPTMNASKAAVKNGKENDLQAELEELIQSQNKSGNNFSTIIPATFLRVTVNC